MSNTNGKIRCPFCGAKLAECFISTKDLTCPNRCMSMLQPTNKRRSRAIFSKGELIWKKYR